MADISAALLGQDVPLGTQQHHITITAVAICIIVYFALLGSVSDLAVVLEQRLIGPP